MSQNWAEMLLFICVVAQFFCVTASMTSASRMMFAFSRDRAVPGHRLWRQVGRNRVPQLLGDRDRRPLGRDHDPGLLELPGRLPRRHRDRRDRPLHRVHPARDPAPPARLDASMPGAWSLGKHYKWIDTIAILWVVFIVFIFLLPPYKSSLPWEDDFTWEALNYAHPRGCRSAAVRRLVVPLGPQLVHGPRAHGHRGGARAARGDELGDFDLPTESRPPSTSWRGRRSAPPPLCVERRRELRLGRRPLHALEVLGRVAREVEVEL